MIIPTLAVPLSSTEVVASERGENRREMIGNHARTMENMW